ncbi:fimbria/pilus periplasmic chaperone [Vibrio jasicida]|uniref:fimbria/pilus periplasmic chaperone n=2 Tax=Vibrio jasicida TaxID=766224 RepID=UPI004067EFA6
MGVVSLMMCASAHSALVLSGTRFIYDSGARAIPVVIMNGSDKLYGGQVWVENSADTESIPFSVSPSIFKVKPNKGEQTVQISQLQSDELKKDRETLFTLHVQEIPTKPNKGLGEDSGAMVLASRIVVKLLYRPESLTASRDRAEERITITRDADKYTFTNPTPYYFAIATVNEKADGVTEAFNQMAPYSANTTVLPQVTGNRLSFLAVDDYGGMRTYQCDLAKVSEQCKRVKKKA